MSDVSIGQNRAELNRIAATYQEAPIQPVADKKEQIQKRLAAIREHLGSAAAELAMLKDDIGDATADAAHTADITEVAHAGFNQLLATTVDFNRLQVLSQSDITVGKAEAGAHDIAALDGDVDKIGVTVSGLDADLATLEASVDQTFSITTSLPESFQRVQDAIDQT